MGWRTIELQCAAGCPFELDCFEKINHKSQICSDGISKTFPDFNDLSGGKRMDKVGVIVQRVTHTPGGHAQFKDLGFLENKGGIAYQATADSE